MGPGPRVAAHDGAVLGLPVVVGGDRAGPDVGPLPHLRVADVGQVRDLRTAAQDSVLGLHEGADLAVLAEVGAGAQVGERADGGAGADHGEQPVRPHHARPGADLAVTQGGVGADHGVLGHDGRPEQLGAREQGDVGGEDHVGVDPGRPRVDDRHAGTHPALEDAAVELAPDLGQLHPVVGALGLAHVGDRVGAGVQARLAGQADQVGEVVLALGVVVAQPRQRLEEEVGVEGQDPGVDLGDLALGGRGVLLLDDRLDLAVGVAQHPAVPRRVGHPPREHAHRAVGGGVLVGEGAQGLPGEQGRVAVRDHDRPGHRALGGERVDRDPDRVAGAELLLLHGQQRVGSPLGHVQTDQLALVAHDDRDASGVQRPHRRQHVADHGAAGDGVQDLRGLRPHPRPAPGSEEDHGQLVRHAPRAGVEPASLVLAHEVCCRAWSSSECRPGPVGPAGDWR
ncbi:hypothetical protein NOCARDAX2BIS_400209 [Nocardioides sp. AX2bis]|nr:hypothetical protein NOCARDAX2BIS_400209 [Nocardioides sp. AX2bis]